MRLFMAREALDPHLKVGGAIFNTQLPTSERAKAVFIGEILTAVGIRTVDGGSAAISTSYMSIYGACSLAAGASKRLAAGCFMP